MTHLLVCRCGCGVAARWAWLVRLRLWAHRLGHVRVLVYKGKP